jgi:hypothetical protein
MVGRLAAYVEGRLTVFLFYHKMIKMGSRVEIAVAARVLAAMGIYLQYRE